MIDLVKIDQDLALWINGFVGRSGALDALMGALVSDYLIPVFSSLVLLGLWFSGSSDAERYRNQLITLTGGVAIGFSNGLVSIANVIVFRDRPFVNLDINLNFYAPTDSSFPANPASVGFAIATVVWMRHRRLGTALYVIAALWGLARVYAGVHYPTDIVGGAFIGIIAALLAAGLVRRLAFIPRHVFRAFRAVYIA
jgi:undecaprenyl-diphosphatase